MRYVHVTLEYFYRWLILWPEAIASYFLWAGPLLARIVVGYVFMLTGWGKLQHLPEVTEYFRELGIPAAAWMTPFVSGIECFGGLFLILGLMTRISAGALAVVMVVAIATAKWQEATSLASLFGFEETAYFTVFFWCAVCGAGRASLDHWLTRFKTQRLTE